MQAADMKKGIMLGTVHALDPVKTFECGQCFRWNAEENGAYYGVFRDKAAKIQVSEGNVYIDSTQEDIESHWREYFDLDRDYSAIEFGYAGDYFARCREFGSGIRILRQDRWESLCSFIISQCNNIPRIKGIVERLCSRFGCELHYDSRIFYTFPPPERLAVLEEGDLGFLRAGYRAKYIISAARAVSDGFSLDELAQMSHEEAVGELCKLNGVGKKVANCVALFGLSIMSGFPIDTWINKALREHFPPGFDPGSFGEYAGLAQQYIFYYARSGPGGDEPV